MTEHAVAGDHPVFDDTATDEHRVVADIPTGRGPTRDRLLVVLREVALSVGAVAGVVCVVFALLGATVGVRTLVVTSGSMTPAIRTGDLVITRPVALADVALGDVVSVVDPRGERITHRVVEVDAARHALRLRGDANDVADPLPYPTDRVDLVLVAVPAGGYVLTWLSSPVATLLLGAYLAFLLWVLWPRGRTRRPGPRHAASTAAGLLVVGLAVGGASPDPTQAAFTDAVPITGVTLATYTVPKPVITDCQASVGQVTVTWNAVSSIYTVSYKAVVAETGQSLTVSQNGTTRLATYQTARLGLNTTHTIQITTALTSTTSWVSVPATQTVKIQLLGLAPSCGAST